MNKYQFALKEVRKMLSFANMFNCENELNEIQELVDKETPMKPIEEDGLLLCGKCENHTVAREGYSGEEWCCYACGQVIDWN